jgi:Putative abortive phage resistance protein AbiGi, antitoxin
MPTQRYVSLELTHFVGKGLSEDQQYSLLVNDILKGGCLKFPPVDDNRCIEGLSGNLPIVGGTRTPGLDDTEAAYSQRTCFCDIPVTDLEIHMNKYSRFGLSFLKRFLIGKGANPVMYVAKNSQALSFRLPESTRDEPWPRRRVFERNIELLEEYRRENRDDIPIYLEYFQDILVLPFIKYFDDLAPDEDEANVYMEREWRVIGDVKFALADVHRVFMPKRYAERFRADLPNYTGQLTFSDNI